MQEEIQKNNGKGKNLLFDDKETLVSIMRKKAKEIPEHPFLIYKNRTFSYREADEISDRIAGLLVAQGIVHEDAVGIMIGRSELMFLYSMAVMKAGGNLHASGFTFSGRTASMRSLHKSRKNMQNIWSKK